ncbi:MAG: zinc-binding dehydrogenase [Pseudomonadota bacterium]
MSDLPTTGLQLRSLVTQAGKLELSLEDVEVTPPGANEVVVRVEASPINPSDLGLLLGMADVSSAQQGGTPERPTVSADIAPAVLKALSGRLDQSLPPGNEGGGVVIAAGDSPEAQALLGKTVGALGGGGMYGQYRTLNVHQCLAMNDGVSPRQAASCFVNPLTALGMVETMRMEGFSGLIHTAAASNLGQMLQKICLADDVPLVNIVRKPEQAELLRGIGATYVCDSSQPSFQEDLVEAIAATAAYIAFDATGGGELANQILAGMEAAAIATATEYSRYGSTQHKQVYIYGGLERSPTILKRNYGMAWNLGGWLLTPFLQKIGHERGNALRQRVADEINTTFASSYAADISLADALQLETLQTYAKQATGQKFLINPNA